MKKTCVWTLIILSFLFSLELFSQKVLNGVVKIRTVDSLGFEETGSGIITGTNGSDVFVVTSYHVVTDDDENQVDSIIVNFHNRRFQSYPAELYEERISEHDFAVIRVPVDYSVIEEITPYKFRSADYDNVKAGDDINAIGHPTGVEWYRNDLNNITSPLFTAFELSFSDMGIQEGYSGGALTTRKRDLLVGLIVNTETSNSLAVSFEHVFKDLHDWGIPYTHILPYKAPRKPSSYVFAALSAVATGAGFYFNNEVDKYYDIYKENRDPGAPVYLDGLERNATLDKAKDNENYRNISWIGAGVSALLSVVLSKRKVKERYGNASFYIEGLNEPYGIGEIGIAYKF